MVEAGSGILGDTGEQILVQGPGQALMQGDGGVGAGGRRRWCRGRGWEVRRGRRFGKAGGVGAAARVVAFDRVGEDA